MWQRLAAASGMRLIQRVLDGNGDGNAGELW